MKTEDSQLFQESLSTDNFAFIYSVHWARSPDIGFEHSTSQIHFSYSTLCGSSAESPLLCVIHCPHLLYATHPESPWQDCPFLAIPWLYVVLIAYLELLTVLVIAGYT